jgi:hypothetical protein
VGRSGEVAGGVGEWMIEKVGRVNINIEQSISFLYHLTSWHPGHQ